MILSKENRGNVSFEGTLADISDGVAVELELATATRVFVIFRDPYGRDTERTAIFNPDMQAGTVDDNLIYYKMPSGDDLLTITGQWQYTVGAEFTGERVVSQQWQVFYVGE